MYFVPSASAKFNGCYWISLPKGLISSGLFTSPNLWVENKPGWMNGVDERVDQTKSYNLIRGKRIWEMFFGLKIWLSFHLHKYYFYFELYLFILFNIFLFSFLCNNTNIDTDKPVYHSTFSLCNFRFVLFDNKHMQMVRMRLL